MLWYVEALRDRICVMAHPVTTGHVYQAFPTLMTHERSIAVMDSVLKGEAANHHTTLKMFTLIYDTLSTLVESNQHKSGEDEVGSGKQVRLMYARYR